MRSSSLSNVLWRDRWLIVGLLVVSSAASWAITRRLPRVYESTTTVLAPKEGSGGLAALAMSNLVQNVPGAPMTIMPSFPSLTPNRDMIVTILKSRTLAEATVKKFRRLSNGRIRLERLEPTNPSREGPSCSSLTKIHCSHTAASS